MNNTSKPNRQYKASVFSALFGEPEKSLEIFNAFSPVQFPPDTPVTMETLDDVLFMDRVNDLAFLVKDLLIVLIEHQSSLNENLPLRLLLYIARVYEKIVDNGSLYRHALVTIPAPQFIVLYNGEQSLPNGEDKMTLKLSDAFQKLPEFSDKVPLDLEVTVYNINEGHNEDILAKSATLKDYSTFIATVRKYLAQEQLLGDAIKNAITECMNAGILVDFLERHSSEVLNMLNQEWNTQTYGEIRFSEGVEHGIQQGVQHGIQLGVQQGEERRSCETARTLFEMNLSLEQIAKATRLSLDKVRELYQNGALANPADQTKLS
jgi:predicted transposase/invertase (TIGR01784 family)